MPTLTTSGAGRQGVVWSAGLTISILKSVIPGDEIFDALSMIIDGVDPFGFNTILTRGFFDEQSKILYKTLSDYSEISYNQCMLEYKNQYPSIDEEDISNICKSFTGVWVIDTPQIDNINSSCYSNYNPPTVVSKSGVPSNQCNSDYIKYYNQYSNQNRDKYIQDNIITSNTISNVVGFKIPNSTGQSNLLDLTPQIQRIKYISYTVISLCILILILILMLLLIN